MNCFSFSILNWLSNESHKSNAVIRCNIFEFSFESLTTSFSSLDSSSKLGLLPFIEI